jgi:hypothetical protein
VTVFGERVALAGLAPGRQREFKRDYAAYSPPTPKQSTHTQILGIMRSGIDSRGADVYKSFVYEILKLNSFWLAVFGCPGS